MYPKNYQTAAKETAVFPQESALEYLSLGLVNEAGEAAGKVKKYLRGDYGFITLRENMKGELGDTLWYLAVLADFLEIELNEIMDQNIEKLQDRMNRGKLKGDGDNR